MREYLPQIGAALAALGLITTIFAVQATGNGSVSAWLLLAMVPFGAGMGTAIPPLIHLVLRAVPTADAGAASGTLVTAQQIGNALGVAIVGTVFFSELGSATSAGSFGDAFTVAMAVQAAFALTAAALVSRARRTSTERVAAGMPAGEGAFALVSGAGQASQQLLAIERLPAAVALDHLETLRDGPLVGGEAVAASGAAVSRGAGGRPRPGRGGSRGSWWRSRSEDRSLVGV